VRAFAFVLAFHFGAEASGGDRWFAADKAKHFFTAALVESMAFSGLRATGLHRTPSLAGAVGVAGAVSIGKEVYDLRFGGDPSLKDLAWDGAGMFATATLLRRTAP
jgi:uncharacterized protein YfiM (DUF2279 family)